MKAEIGDKFVFGLNHINFTSYIVYYERKLDHYQEPGKKPVKGQHFSRREGCCYEKYWNQSGSPGSGSSLGTSCATVAFHYASRSWWILCQIRPQHDILGDSPIIWLGGLVLSSFGILLWILERNLCILAPSYTCTIVYLYLCIRRLANSIRQYCSLSLLHFHLLDLLVHLSREKVTKNRNESWKRKSVAKISPDLGPFSSYF